MKNEVYIVAGGSSLRGFDFSSLDNKDTIVVNKSILDVPHPTYFITVDFTFLRKLGVHKLESKDTTKVFIACLHFPYIEEKDGRIVDTRFNLVYDLSDFDVIIKSRKVVGIGYQFKDFRNGLNSGFCALQLAVILGYTKIYLLGVDLCFNVDNGLSNKSTHYHGGYGENITSFNKKLSIYYDYFADGIHELKCNPYINVEVISLSPISRLNNIIEYVDYRKVL